MMRDAAVGDVVLRAVQNVRGAVFGRRGRRFARSPRRTRLPVRSARKRRASSRRKGPAATSPVVPSCRTAQQRTNADAGVRVHEHRGTAQCPPRISIVFRYCCWPKPNPPNSMGIVSLYMPMSASPCTTLSGMRGLAVDLHVVDVDVREGASPSRPFRRTPLACLAATWVGVKQFAFEFAEEERLRKADVRPGDHFFHVLALLGNLFRSEQPFTNPSKGSLRERKIIRSPECCDCYQFANRSFTGGFSQVLARRAAHPTDHEPMRTICRDLRSLLELRLE